MANAFRARARTLALLCASCLSLPLRAQDTPTPRGPTVDAVRAAAQVIGLVFEDAELELMRGKVAANLRNYEAVRSRSLPNEVAPALTFTPFLAGITDRALRLAPRELTLPDVERPAKLDALAFADIRTLAALVKARKVSCVELAELFLGRLQALDASLHFVITLTRERALETARGLDAELAAGKWRGPLHGIPYGAKDLLAARGYPTTWGAKPYVSQVLDYDATVIEKLERAGAVLVAKLTLGALAWGDVWFGGTTRNPWRPEQGSSGSSAGSASATAAGAVPFALGSETLGSIVSPSHRCGCSSLRPTFGRVSRHGAMALAWSLDKLGPICRSADDAAIVFAAIHGSDGKDQAAYDKPFVIPVDVDVKGTRIGYQKRWFRRDAAAQRVLDDLRELGCELIEIELPQLPVREMMFVLQAEAAAAFDELTRSGKDDQLVRQVTEAWPNVFRAARLIPAVEYLQANRLRVLLMRELDAVMQRVDVIVHPSFAGNLLAMTNLTGHPTFIAPAGPARRGAPPSISFTGQLCDESRLLALVSAWQRRTKWHLQQPK